MHDMLKLERFAKRVLDVGVFFGVLLLRLSPTLESDGNGKKGLYIPTNELGLSEHMPGTMLWCN